MASETPDAARGTDVPRSGPLAPDYLVVAYLAATGLLGLVTWTATGVGIAAAHALGAGAVLWWAPRPLPRGRVRLFVRLFYPVILTPLLYTELQHLNQLVVPGYFDGLVQAWEASLLGGQVSLTAARRWPQLWLSELLHLGYFSYYFVVPGAAVAAYLDGGPGGLNRLTVSVALAFFLCYLCFAVFPVAGPRYEFVRIAGEPSRGAVFSVVHTVLEAGSSKGTAFPSSHVAAALASVLACWRESRRWFRVSLLPVVLLTLGTVYGRFHYGVDALAGVAVAFAAFAATPWLVGRLEPAGER